ncbi:MAG TPA: hypothetical protein VND64_10385 [Pirellulales bacterium]|nr:hypothetical protein [Pirellulales bacterium]
MAQIDIEYPGETSTTFVAPAHDILLLSNSRDYLTEVLVRKAMNLEELKRSQRSLSSSFPEWEHVDFSARQWGIRHFKHPPDRPLDWPFLGLIYNAEGGDISKISYLCENENAERFVSHNSRFRQYSLRSRQPAIIDVSENVRRKGDLSYFFHHLFNDFTR